MRYTKVAIEALGYELGPNVVTSRALEDRLAPLYETLRIQPGQLAALTGIRERRFWDPGTKPSDGALRAARKALEASRVDRRDLGVVVFTGVCRDNLEPATACAVASGLGLRGDVIVQDISNACLGVLSGMIDVANRIELGQVKAGLVVSCESAREITDIMIDRLLADRRMENFRTSLATLTGGSGAVAVLLCDQDVAFGHRFLGGAVRAAPEHHKICRWGPDTGIPPSAPMVMETDAVSVLQNGVALGRDTWRAFLGELSWRGGEDVNRVFCHQVTAGHSAAVLEAFGIGREKDFSTVEFLGNMGTAALPTGLAIGAERGVVSPGDRVALLGIGSGLNCMMLGVEW
jgi:3-oxoacyl-[acyl-carrier-protein] synthase-3